MRSATYAWWSVTAPKQEGTRPVDRWLARRNRYRSQTTTAPASRTARMRRRWIADARTSSVRRSSVRCSLEAAPQADGTHHPRVAPPHPTALATSLPQPAAPPTPMVATLDPTLLRPNRWLLWVCVWALLAELALAVTCLATLAAVEAQLSASMLLAGLVLAVAAAAWRWRVRLGSPDARVALGVVLTVWGSTALSVRWPGGVTTASHGLTVVGACPIVALDVAIDADGRLAFRPKRHRVSWDELRPLADGAELVLVGTGWAGAAVVDADAARHLRGRLEVLTTGEAIARYRQLRARGRRVALLAHTTC